MKDNQISVLSGKRQLINRSEKQKTAYVKRGAERLKSMKCAATTDKTTMK